MEKVIKQRTVKVLVEFDVSLLFDESECPSEELIVDSAKRAMSSTLETARKLGVVTTKYEVK